MARSIKEFDLLLSDNSNLYKLWSKSKSKYASRKENCISDSYRYVEYRFGGYKTVAWKNVEDYLISIGVPARIKTDSVGNEVICFAVDNTEVIFNFFWKKHETEWVELTIASKMLV